MPFHDGQEGNEAGGGKVHVAHRRIGLVEHFAEGERDRREVRQQRAGGLARQCRKQKVRDRSHGARMLRPRRCAVCSFAHMRRRCLYLVPMTWHRPPDQAACLEKRRTRERRPAAQMATSASGSSRSYSFLTTE